MPQVYLQFAEQPDLVTWYLTFFLKLINSLSTAINVCQCSTFNVPTSTSASLPFIFQFNWLMQNKISTDNVKLFCDISTQ